MTPDLFTREFRKKLKHLVRTASPTEARALAVKISPIFSLLFGAIVLLHIGNYSYLTLVFVLASSVLLGALLAYRYARLVLWIMRPLTLYGNDPIFSSKEEIKSEGAQDNG